MKEVIHVIFNLTPLEWAVAGTITLFAALGLSMIFNFAYTRIENWRYERAVNKQEARR